MSKILKDVNKCTQNCIKKIPVSKIQMPNSPLFYYGLGFTSATFLFTYFDTNETRKNAKKVYDNLTVNNALEFCGSIWITKNAYDYVNNLIVPNKPKSY